MASFPCQWPAGPDGEGPGWGPPPRPGAGAVAIPPLAKVIGAYEAVAALGRPAGAPAPRVRAIALNTASMDLAGAKAALEQCRESTGLVCDDPVRHGGETMLTGLLASPAMTAP